jgi:hypothetical protein
MDGGVRPSICFSVQQFEDLDFILSCPTKTCQLFCFLPEKLLEKGNEGLILEPQ